MRTKFLKKSLIVSPFDVLRKKFRQVPEVLNFTDEILDMIH